MIISGRIEGILLIRIMAKPMTSVALHISHHPGPGTFLLAKYCCVRTKTCIRFEIPVISKIVRISITVRIFFGY
jgi:hypothetical protein